MCGWGVFEAIKQGPQHTEYALINRKHLFQCWARLRQNKLDS